MSMVFAMFAAVATFCALLITYVALHPPGSDITLILGGVYGLIAAVLWVGAAVTAKMDASKKDVPK